MKKKIENYEQTKDRALRLLEFRAHSEKELYDKLRRDGADPEDIEKTLDFCSALRRICMPVIFYRLQNYGICQQFDIFHTYRLQFLYICHIVFYFCRKPIIRRFKRPINRCN